MQTSSSPGSLRALILVAMAHLSTSLSAMGVSPLAPFFQPELRISKAEVGIMMSAFYLGVVALSIPAGYLSDRLGLRWVSIIGNTTLGAFIFLVPMFPSFPAVLLSMAIAGLGFSFVNPVTTKAIMSWFRARRRATAMSIKQMGVTIGGVLGAALLPSIASSFDWHVALQVAGTFTIVSGLIIAVLYKEAPPMEEALPPASQMGELRKVLGNRQILFVGIVSGIFAMTQASVTGYLVLFLHEAQALSVVTAGVGLAVAQLTGTFGRIGWGFASDVLFHGLRRMTLLVIGIVIIITSLIAAILPPGQPLWALVAVCALFGASTLGWNGVLLTLTGESSPRHLVGLTSGLVSSITFLGAVVWSPVFGYVADATGSFGYAWAAVAALMLAGVFVIKFGLGEATGWRKIVPTNR